MKNRIFDESDRKLLRFIEDFSRRTGHPPTYSEMADICQLGSTGQVQYRLSRLERYGKITKVAGQARSVRLVPQAKCPGFGMVSKAIKSVLTEIVDFATPQQNRRKP